MELVFTKEQYKFLKSFSKKSRICKKEDKILNELNREKIPFVFLVDLLKSHPKLCPAEPLAKDFDEMDSREKLYYIRDIYLEKIGLSEFIEISNSGYCCLTCACLKNIANINFKV